MKPKKGLPKLSTDKRLDLLLQETEDELLGLQPKIEKLERAAQDLKDLKLRKQRLLTLKLSLITMLESKTSEVFKHQLIVDDETSTPETPPEYDVLKEQFLFQPEQALAEMGSVLKQKQTINADIFRAVVFFGGKATTEEIRRFLVENEITQPQSGKSFTDAPLTEISSRANYLVRKGILHPYQRGTFYTHLGWQPIGE